MTGAKKNRFARYGFQKSKIKKSKVHHSLFHPTNEGILSVQATDDMERDEIELIGREIGVERGDSLYGWGTVDQSDFEREGLTVCTDDDPRPGHTNIGGWPKQPEILTGVQKALAEAANAAGHVHLACCTTTGT